MRDTLPLFAMAFKSKKIENIEKPMESLEKQKKDNEWLKKKEYDELVKKKNEEEEEAMTRLEIS